MFESVPSNVDFVEQERRILDFWRRTDAFQKLVALRKDGPKWSFIDGPITANNPMGVHHGWGRTYKDLYHRFWAMKGYRTRYQNGFDCQGLWVEVNVERELDFQSKRDIENYGVGRFVRKCKERVLRCAAIQTEQSIRLGYWMDWNDPDFLRDLAVKLIENPEQPITVEGPRGPVTDTVEQIVARLGLPELGGSYFTFSNENNYMIWTFLKRCSERGWVYKGTDVMPWCPRCATAISQHEIVTEGYQEMTHPAVTLRFPLRGRPGENLLVWTTTPWTLTSNVAAAVGPELTYVKVRQGDQVFYLSKGTLPTLNGKYEVLEEMPGTALEGWTYDGPFDELEAQQAAGGPQAHRVILWDEVGETEGTGIVHIAPGCGAEDFALGKEHHLPAIAPLDEEGYFIAGFGPLSGAHVSESAERVFASLREKGLLYKVEDYTHRYPVCWRCQTDLVFRLVDEWFISMDELRYDMMRVTEQIRWIPSFGLERELDWLRNMHDWMISKKRYWGLALPIWECERCGHFTVIGDEEELKARAVEGWEQFEGHTPHKPWIDAVRIACPQCGAHISRIPDVGNPWLDAGIVSFSTMQYRTNPDYWREWYPADLISESFPGQFRNWFYSLLAMATVLENTPPFLTCFSYATLLAEDGKPMHKSWGNMIEFNEAADRMGVDVMRWLYCAHKPENDLRFGFGRADEVRRQVLIPLWNVYSFFVTYANIDGWMPPASDQGAGSRDGVAGTPAPRSLIPALSLLDRWILARLSQLVAEVTARLDEYDAYGATMAVETFLDDLSNWYVRRSRRRFWKSEHDADKNAAYATLYRVLLMLTRLLAPFMPFVTEAMYQNLARSVSADAPESVHHTLWPQADEAAVDRELLAQMALARQVVTLGHSARAAKNVKVRQPLARALVHLAAGAGELSDELLALARDELNVKEVRFVADEAELVTYRLLPDNKLLGPRFGQRFPALRAALAEIDASAAVRRLRAGLPLQLTLDGETVELAPGEMLVQENPQAGLAVAIERGVTVAVDVTLTPELVSEGLAREVIRRIQNLRKEAGLELDDRIVAAYQAAGELAEAIAAWRALIMAETLSVEFTAGPPAAGDAVAEERVGGCALTLGIHKV